MDFVASILFFGRTNISIREYCGFFSKDRKCRPLWKSPSPSLTFSIPVHSRDWPWSICQDISDETFSLNITFFRSVISRLFYRNLSKPQAANSSMDLQHCISSGALGLYSRDPWILVTGNPPVLPEVRYGFPVCIGQYLIMKIANIQVMSHLSSLVVVVKTRPQRKRWRYSQETLVSIYRHESTKGSMFQRRRMPLILSNGTTPTTIFIIQRIPLFSKQYIQPSWWLAELCLLRWCVDLANEYFIFPRPVVLWCIPFFQILESVSDLVPINVDIWNRRDEIFSVPDTPDLKLKCDVNVKVHDDQSRSLHTLERRVVVLCKSPSIFSNR